VDDGLVQVLVLVAWVVLSMVAGARKKQRQGEALRQDSAGEQLAEGSEDSVETDESLVPGEVWEEIAALASGVSSHADGASFALDRVASPIPQVGDRFEERSPPLPVSVRAGREDRESLALARRVPVSVMSEEAAEAAEDAREAAETAAFHKIHSVGIANRKKDEHYLIASSGRSTLLRLFGERGGRAGQLRRAVLLSEILGPPVSLQRPRDPSP